MYRSFPTAVLAYLRWQQIWKNTSDQNLQKAKFAFHLYKRYSTDKTFWKLVSLGQTTTFLGYIHVLVFYIMISNLAVEYTEDGGKMILKFWYPPTRPDNVDTQIIILNLYCFKFISMSLQLFHIHSFQWHLTIIIWPSNPNVAIDGWSYFCFKWICLHLGTELSLLSNS